MTDKEALDIARQMVVNLRETAICALASGGNEDDGALNNETIAAMYEQHADALEHLVRIVSQISE